MADLCLSLHDELIRCKVSEADWPAYNHKLCHKILSSIRRLSSSFQNGFRSSESVFRCGTERAAAFSKASTMLIGSTVVQLVTVLGWDGGIHVAGSESCRIV